MNEQARCLRHGCGVVRASSLYHWARHRVGAAVLALLAAVLFASGCATRELRGTPYYTDTMRARRSAKGDPVNLWPLLYYRNPILEVLWPLVESTDNYFALRPLMSVYGTSEEDQITSVAWPIAQFDERRNSHRIFPFFWGRNRFAAFPLYWHWSDPRGREGVSDTLVPLWSHYHDPDGYSTHVFWPFFHVRNLRGKAGWRVWPLYGNYRSSRGSYGFYLWPLGHHRTWAGGNSEHAFLPLYYRKHGPRDSLFLSLLYAQGKKANDSAWHWVFPLFYHSRDPHSSKLITPLYWAGRNETLDSDWRFLMPLYLTVRRGDDRFLATLLGGYSRKGENLSWMALPLLSGGAKGKEAGSVWVVGPLAHASWRKDGKASHVFPLYYYGRRGGKSTFLSLPWCSGREGRDSSWQLLPPVFFNKRDREGRLFVTPLFAGGSSARAGSKWHTLLPLYYSRKSPDGKVLATLLGGYRTDAEGGGWLIYPLLSGGKVGKDEGEVWVVAPLFHARWNEKGKSHHLLPLYYWNAEDRTFVSPLAARWNDGADGRQMTLIPPLLSLHTSDEKTKDLWMLAGMARWSWGEEPGARYLLPLVYSNKRTGAFVSPLAAKWQRDADTSTTMIPPALSWITSRKERKDLWVVGPLAHFSWGPDAGGQHVFPLYYANRKTDCFISPVVASWQEGGIRHRICPVLLSGYSVDGDEKTLNVLLGMFQQKWGGGESSGRLVPLYFYEGSREFYTPLFGWNKDERNGFFYPLTPLVGFHTGDSRGGWLFPLLSHKRDRDTGDYSGTFLWGTYRKRGRHTRSGIFPIYGYSNDGSIKAAPERTASYDTYGKKFWSLPACWYQNRLTIHPDRRSGRAGRAVRRFEKRHGFFPVWSYSSRTMPEREVEDVDGSLLWLLYDYERRGRPNREQVRARVLWRFWHYERRNGNVEMDMFPAITYRRNVDGHKRMSFLWRLFRYERTDKGRKLDLFFIPLMR